MANTRTSILGLAAAKLSRRGISHFDANAGATLTVIVLSSSPTTTKKIIDVDLPRPRDIKMLSSSRFAEMHGEILECLFEEAAKAFQQGMKGASDIIEGSREYHVRKSPVM